MNIKTLLYIVKVREYLKHFKTIVYSILHCKGVFILCDVIDTFVVIHFLFKCIISWHFSSYIHINLKFFSSFSSSLFSFRSKQSSTHTHPKFWRCASLIANRELFYILGMPCTA
jgi:hypothetical protein